MPDLYCRRCGEPWDMDYVNFEMTAVERIHFKDGDFCPSCEGKEVKERPLRAELMQVASDLLGDDEDGIAAMMEDAELMFGEEF